MAESTNPNYKKELKVLEGEKRAALKKAKGSKGKKAKDDVALVEADFDAKFKALQAKYCDDEVLVVAKPGAAESTSLVLNNDETTATTTITTSATVAALQPNDVETTADETEQQIFQRKKLEKATRKRNEAREKERMAEQALQDAKALPNAKDIELKNMQLPKYAQIKDVIADGHCLYRAIAAQMMMTDSCDYRYVRNVAADSLLLHRDSLEAFCCTSQYDDYVNRVRNSADWGGHLELRALSLALKRPIVVYSTGPPLMIGVDDAPPIRLSYHLHYYALGEHYNQVVIEEPKGTATSS